MVMARHRYCCELRFQIRSSCSVGCFSECDRAVFSFRDSCGFPGYRIIGLFKVLSIDSKSGLRNFYRWWKFEDLPYECQTTLLRIFHFSLSISGAAQKKTFAENFFKKSRESRKPSDFHCFGGEIISLGNFSTSQNVFVLHVWVQARFYI